MDPKSSGEAAKNSMGNAHNILCAFSEHAKRFTKCFLMLLHLQDEKKHYKIGRKISFVCAAALTELYTYCRLLADDGYGYCCVGTRGSDAVACSNRNNVSFAHTLRR